jgi:hypothetical protein
MNPGRLFIIIGLSLACIGAALLWAPWLLSWFGRLPGDIRVEREGFSFRFPVVSMIVISIVLSVLLNLLARR